MVAHGLPHYGFKKEALELADRSFAVAAADRAIHEWYNAETGQPLDNHPLSAGPQVLMRMLRTELDTGFDPSAIGNTDARIDSSKLRNALGLTEPFLEQTSLAGLRIDANARRELCRTMPFLVANPDGRGETVRIITQKTETITGLTYHLTLDKMGRTFSL